MTQTKQCAPKPRNPSADDAPMAAVEWDSRPVEREQDFRRGYSQGFHESLAMVKSGAQWFHLEKWHNETVRPWRFQELLLREPPPEPPESFDLVPMDSDFPVTAFPEPIGSYIVESSKAIGCDQSMIALPMLASLAAAIGNTRRIRLKPTWCEPSILWTAVVCESGQRKTPAIDAATMFLKAEQTETTRHIVSDVTREGLVSLLAAYPRGLLLNRDELAGWFSFGEYKKQSGGDVAFWLELYGGKSVTVDRKAKDSVTGKQEATHIPVASCSVTGGIQPGALRRVLGPQHFDNGLAARFLLAYPPIHARRWRDDSVNPDLQSRVAEVFRKLVQLSFAGNLFTPLDLPLTDSGQQAFIAYVDKHGTQTDLLEGKEKALWSKLEGGAARIALIVHCVRVCAGDTSLESQDAIDGQSIAAGVLLAEWFGEEGIRIYELLAESEAESDQLDLIDWIRRHGGRVTVRQVMQGVWRLKAHTAAMLALNSLVQAGLGEWRNVPPGTKGGRPTQVFVLFDLGEVS